MKTVSALKKDLEFNSGLSSLIEVLKTIAVSQYRALEHRLKSYEEFLRTIENFFRFLDINSVDHPFLKPKKNTQIIVAVTSDSGLLGGLNVQVVGNAIRELDKIPGRLVVIGERGKIYAREAAVAYTAFSGIKEEARFAQAMQVRDYLIKKIAEEQFGHLKVIFPYPVSFTIQRVETSQFLPFLPTRGTSGPASAFSFSDIIFESEPSRIVEYLVYLWMGQKLYEIFGLSRLAEFAARYVHLEESAQKLKELDKKTRLEYFRVRHEIIDRNMRELFSARLLYAHKH
jgi:ATP synthase F1 gamma subunit